MQRAPRQHCSGTVCIAGDLVKASVVVFPGTNRERDMSVALTQAGFSVDLVWHQETNIPQKTDILVLPGGFAHGDYLRPGAMAAHSAIMRDAISKAREGMPVFGVCNGFQILLETGLLPGSLRRNHHGRFVCQNVTLRTENSCCVLTQNIPNSSILSVPVAHHDGCYDIDHIGLQKLHDQGRIVFRYEGLNPNGSIEDIAGICSENGRILGMMPHPEDHVLPKQGNTDGTMIFEAFANMFRG